MKKIVTSIILLLTSSLVIVNIVYAKSISKSAINNLEDAPTPTATPTTTPENTPKPKNPPEKPPEKPNKNNRDFPPNGGTGWSWFFPPFPNERRHKPVDLYDIDLYLFKNKAISNKLYNQIVSAWADALDMKASKLKMRLKKNETIYEIAELKGFSSAEFYSLLYSIRNQTIQKNK